MDRSSTKVRHIQPLQSPFDPIDLFRYYIDSHCVVVIGRPSAMLAERLEREENIRIAKQIEVLGLEGLQRAEAELQEAKAEHDRPIPPDILTSFPLPDVKSIAWIPVQSLQEPGVGRARRFELAPSELSRHVASDRSALPFFVQYDHVQVCFRRNCKVCDLKFDRQSDFITITVFLSLAKLSNRLRPWVIYNSGQTSIYH
jgi:hypothetical protein